MIIFPRCKINLGLNVLEKRPDGFHDLQSIMIEIPWKDEISVKEGTDDSFRIEGLEIAGTTNLVTEALKLARTKASIPPLEIILKKNIPMGAGLGGGSADAAYCYRYLAENYFPERSHKDLEKDISQLGSDCAFFIHGKVQYAIGRGEILTPVELNLKGKYIVLVNLGIHISTQFAFSNIVPNSIREALIHFKNEPIENWKNVFFNDFEKPVFKLHPELEKLKEFFYTHGAAYASMTGSGSTVYGIFDSKPNLDTEQFGANSFVKEFVFE